MTERKPSIKLNMALNVILTISSIIFPLISMQYVTRVLGPDGMGKVYFATSVITLFSMFAELGIPVYGIRACARVRDDRAALSRTVHELMLINLITCVAVYIVFAAALVSVPVLRQSRALLMIMSSGMLLNALGAEWLYKALEEYRYITIRTIFFKTAALAGIFALIRQKDDYVLYGTLTIFAAAASNLLNLLRLRRHIDWRSHGGFVLPAAELKKHIRPMLVIFMMLVATAVYTNIDMLLLGVMKGDTETGLYGVSVKIKLGMVNLVTAASAVLMPRMSYYIGRGRAEEAGDLIEKTLTAVCLIAFPLVCCIVMLAPECISLLAGSEFAGAVMPMRVIMPAVIFIAISNIAGMQKLIPMGHEASVTRAAWIGACVDTALNIFLIPAFASAGAAAAAMITESVVMLCLLRSVRLAEGRSMFKGIPLPGIIIAAVMAMPACIPAVKTDAVLIVRTVAAGCCYMAVYALLIWLVWTKWTNNRKEHHK